MVPSRDGQTNQSAQKEAAKSDHIRTLNRIAFKNIKGKGNEEKEKSTQDMTVDVDGLIVQVKKTLEAFGKRIGLWPIMSQDEVVVFSPCRQRIVSD